MHGCYSPKLFITISVCLVLIGTNNLVLQATNAWLPEVTIGLPTRYCEWVPHQAGRVARGWVLGQSTWDNDAHSLSEDEDWCPSTPSVSEGCRPTSFLEDGSMDSTSEQDNVKAYEVGFLTPVIHACFAF